jgi:hypothetical protein
VPRESSVAVEAALHRKIMLTEHMVLACIEKLSVLKIKYKKNA